MQEELTPPRNLSSWFNKKFLQFASSTTSSFNPSICSPRHHRTHSSPSYMSPTRSQLGPSNEEFVIGCTVCGSRAIEETCFADQPQFSNGIEDPNSGAYARIIAYYEKPLENYAQSSTELKSMLKSFNDNEAERQFEAVVEAKEGSPVVKRIVYKEFSPPSKNPLTPLNHKDKQLVKECFYSNPLAEKYVKEEERKIVASRRTEYQQRSNGQVKTFVRTDTGEVKSKMLSRAASEANSFYKSSTQKIIAPVMQANRGRKGGKNAVGKLGTKGHKYKISLGDDQDHDSNSSDMIVHFDMKRTGSKTSLNSGKGFNSYISSKNRTPSNKSVGSAKSDKHLLQVPGPSLTSRSRNASPSAGRSKNPSRGPSPNTFLPIPKSKSNSRSPSPFLDAPKKNNSRSPSPFPGKDSDRGSQKSSAKEKSGKKDFLSIPCKSPRSSRSNSPISDSSINSGSRSPVGSSNKDKTKKFFGNDKLGKEKYGKDKSNKDKYGKDKSNKDKYGKDKYGKDKYGKDKYGNDKTGKFGKKHVNVALKTKPKQGVQKPLPKLFEPRNLKEFFIVQKIAATIIQRHWRKIRDNRKKNSASAQWEPKDFAGDCMFTSEELFKAMKLLGNFADYMEKQGRKII